MPMAREIATLVKKATLPSPTTKAETVILGQVLANAVLLVLLCPTYPIDQIH